MNSSSCSLWSSGNNTCWCIYIICGQPIVCLLNALILSCSSSLILTITRAPRTNKWQGLISVCAAKHHRLTFTVQGSAQSGGAVQRTAGMFTHWAFPYWSYVSEQGGEPSQISKASVRTWIAPLCSPPQLQSGWTDGGKIALPTHRVRTLGLNTQTITCRPITCRPITSNHLPATLLNLHTSTKHWRHFPAFCFTLQSKRRVHVPTWCKRKQTQTCHDFPFKLKSCCYVCCGTRLLPTV